MMNKRIILHLLFVLIFKTSCFCQTIQLTAPAIFNEKNTVVIYQFQNPIVWVAQDVIDMKYAGQGQFSAVFPVAYAHWIEIYNTPTLILPRQNITGTIINENDYYFFQSTDSNNVNFFLERIFVLASQNSGYSTDIESALPRVANLKKLFDSSFLIIQQADFKKRYQLDDIALLAIKEFFSSYIGKIYSYASISSLTQPERELLHLQIQQNLNLYSGKYWLQSQAGMLFLKKYFLNVSLPLNKYDVEKTLAADKFFNDKLIQRYLWYIYFMEIAEKNEIPHNKAKTDSLFTEYQIKFTFSPKEKNLLSILKFKRSNANQNIKELFTSQELVGVDNKPLTKTYKTSLITANPDIIIYYWASWCAPCVSFIEALKKDKLTYHSKLYKVIFISIDDKNTDWLKNKYPVLNSTNSFRLTNLTATSIFSTYISTITLPHFFLIENGIMKNSDVEKDSLKN